MTATPQLSDIQAGSIDQYQINSNSGGGGKDMSAGVTDLRYYESILSNNITASDKAKLDEYMYSIREVELELERRDQLNLSNNSNNNNYTIINRSFSI